MEYEVGLRKYLAFLTKWNQSINLSAARTPEQREEHLIDSLHVIPRLIEVGPASVIDVGSGGGFPVIPASLCCPSTSFISLEPTHKKHAFLRTVARELELVNLECFAQRAEDHERDDYDAAMSRATFDLVDWFELGSSLVRVGGSIFGFEGLPRNDLPPGIVRSQYTVDEKSRAILQLVRT